MLYADVMTNSLRKALEETARRRTKQTAWNDAHGESEPVSRLRLGWQHHAHTGRRPQ